MSFVLQVHHAVIKYATPVHTIYEMYNDKYKASQSDELSDTTKIWLVGEIHLLYQQLLSRIKKSRPEVSDNVELIYFDDMKWASLGKHQIFGQVEFVSLTYGISKYNEISNNYIVRVKQISVGSVNKGFNQRPKYCVVLLKWYARACSPISIILCKVFEYACILSFRKG